MIKTPDLVEHLTPKCHVPAPDLGSSPQGIGQYTVFAVVHDPQTIHQVLALGQPCRRRCFPERKNSAAYTVCAPASHGRSHLGDPIRGGEDVIIDERDDRSSSLRDPSIARVAYSLSRLKYVDN